MKSLRHLSTLGAASALLSVGLLATGSLAGAANAHDEQPTSHAVFVESDQPGANTVLSYTRGTDGSLSYVATYPTGGAGATAAGAAAYTLASQGGLALVDNGRELIATNPGSDTVSVFAVDGAYLRLVQQISTGGSFPVSISSRNDLVAVLNAGGAGSLIEYRLRGEHLAAIAGQVRSLGLANTTPPDFVHGAGQVGYSPDGRFLVVTTKHSTDSFEVFGVTHDGTLSASATITAATNAVPFAFNFDSHGHVVAAEASNSSVSTYAINPDGSLSALGTVSDGAKALCWIATAQGYFFGSNAASATVSSFGDAGAAPTLLNAVAASTHPGTTDAAASPDGQFLYVESGGSGALDAFAVASNGSLTPIETLWNLPKPFEGIAVS